MVRVAATWRRVTGERVDEAASDCEQGGKEATGVGFGGAKGAEVMGICNSVGEGEEREEGREGGEEL